MRNYYFTFGSDAKYPYQYGYVLVQAANLPMAINLFNAIYPPRKGGCVNCAFFYCEKDFLDTRMKNDTCHAVISFMELNR